MNIIKCSKVNKINKIHLHLRNNKENLLINKIDIKEGIIITCNHKEFLNKCNNNSSNNNTNRSNVFIQLYEFIFIENKPFRMTFTKNFQGE